MAKLDVEPVTGRHPRVARTYYRLRLSEGERYREALSKSEQWCIAKRTEIQTRLGLGEDEETVWRDLTSHAKGRAVRLRRGR